jgi:hypothetical protein
MQGSWHIIDMPGYVAGFAGVTGSAYIVLDGRGGGALAFGYVTGTLHAGICAEAIAFVWDGSDEIDEVGGHGWGEVQPDGSLVGRISFDGGEETCFVARPLSIPPTIH